MLKSALQRMGTIFPLAILEDGQNYQNDGHVLNVRLSDGLLKGRVKGRSNQIYDVHLDLKTWPQSQAKCSCVYRVNCKHAVACLYELEQRASHPPSSASSFLDLGSTSSRHPAKREILEADESEWYSEVTEDRHDFFSYQLGIKIDNQDVNIVPLIVNYIKYMEPETLESLSDHKVVALPLSEGKILHITLGRIKPLLRLLFQYWNNKRSKELDLKINRYQLILMQEAELAIKASATRWKGTSAVQAQLKQLSLKTVSVDAPIPNGLKTELRDYQHQGLSWLQCLRLNHFGGVLADDMGLGKTVQTLAHLQSEKEQGRLCHASLIIAPTSLVWNWYDEASRFTPELKTLVFHGAERHKGSFSDYDIVISTYGLIQREKQRFLEYDFYYIILDEAQSIKNSRAKTTQMVQQIKGSHRLCLTGTPLENHLGELWSLYHFLMPGFLGDLKQFRQFFRVPIEKQANQDRREILVKRISPFILRRTKNQVARELPEKTEMTQMLELIGPQRDLYEAIRMSMEEKVRHAIARQGLGKSQILLLDALLRLRQVCCDPRLLSLPDASIAHGTSVKLTSLMELLDSLMDEGRFVLVFSQFTSMLKIIEKALIARSYPCLKLTGATQNREKIVRDFQDGKAPIFLISLKAGGVGLNLTRADTVIHYDPWWNPAAEDQATDRTHRIGQEHPVFVYKLITTGTVEEVILRMQAKKRELFEGVLSTQNNHQMVLTEADITAFFSPLPIVR